MERSWLPRRFPRDALALGFLAGVACAGKPPGPRPIEVVVPTEAAVLDPRFATRSLDVKITRLVHAGLVGLSPDTLAPEPLVAESLRFEDHRTLTVELRPNVTFHGGRPLEPADVCATLAAIADRTLGSPHRPVVSAIGGCEVNGPRSLTLRLAEPRATLLTDLEIPILRKEEALSAPRPDGDLDGLGPFRITSVKPGEVSLAPASTGVVPTPRHAVTVRTVKDENARVQRLLAGRSDVAPNAVSPNLLPAIEQGGGGLDVVARPGANLTYLLAQNERRPFDRQPVRRSLARAIDRDLIVRTLLAGRARVAHGLLPPDHWAAQSSPGEPFDPDGARRVLGGLPPVTLLTSTDRSRVTVARAVAQMLGDAGLPTSVVPLDLGVLLGRLDAGDFELAILQIPELTEPNVLSWFFHPRGVPGEGGEGKNRARYRSAVAGDLLDRASRLADPALRRGLYAELAVTLARDLPVIPLWHEDQVAVVSARARAFRPSAEGRWLGLSRLE